MKFLEANPKHGHSIPDQLENKMADKTGEMPSETDTASQTNWTPSEADTAPQTRWETSWETRPEITTRARIRS